MERTDVALKKIALLMSRDDYLSIVKIDADEVELEFKNSTCIIDNFGKVTWTDK